MSSENELTRKPGGKRERTRAALVAAALEIVAEKGFAAASLDEIAAKAGMTKGAIYSNFSSKAELMLAAMGAKGLVLSSPRPPATTIQEELAAMAGELAQVVRRARAEAALIAEFNLYALGDPVIRKEVAATYAEGFTSTAGYLAGLKRRTDAMSPRHLAVALQCIAMGFMIQSLVTPDEITEVLIRETMQALAEGLTRPRGG